MLADEQAAVCMWAGEHPVVQRAGEGGAGAPGADDDRLQPAVPAAAGGGRAVQLPATAVRATSHTPYIHTIWDIHSVRALCALYIHTIQVTQSAISTMHTLHAIHAV